MIDGSLSAVPPPFRYRVLIPLVARALPVDSLSALRAITYVSLFATYVLILMMVQRLGSKPLVAGMGLVVTWSMQSHTYAFVNPILIDAAAALWITLSLYALVRRSAIWFGLACVGGVLTRETAVLMAFALGATKRWPSAVLTFAIVGALFVGVRVWLHVPGDLTAQTAYLTNAFGAVISAPMTYAARVYLSWTWSWCLLPVGILLLAVLNRVDLTHNAYYYSQYHRREYSTYYEKTTIG
jgi:hypothetical protein